DLRGSCAHVTQSEAFTFLQGSFGDSRSIIFYFKNEIRRIPAKSHAYHCSLGVANGVADRLLSNTRQLMLYARRQSFFGYVVGPEITAQPARNARALNQTLQHRGQS